jgi:Ni,Fe-hydrogenase maturation factor
MPRVVIVAYGNLLRSDDAVGWIVADELQRRLHYQKQRSCGCNNFCPKLRKSVSRTRDCNLCRCKPGR